MTAHLSYKKFKEFEKRAYSTVYAEGEGTYHDDIIKQLAEQFLNSMNVPKKANILDIGCGPGTFLEAARDLGYKNTVGVTLSSEDHRSCKQKNFKTLNSSMSDLDCEDNTVDFIWCRHSLEHSPYPLFTLYEFHRVLNDDGQIWIEVPCPDNQRAFIHEFNPNHYSIMGIRMWQGLFEKSGFVLNNSYVYDIDVNVPSGKTNEKSYIFLLSKSKESLKDLFLRKYNIQMLES